MVITSEIFEGYLKCPLKCWLQFHGEVGAGNQYSNWMHERNESYRIHGIEQVLSSRSIADRAVAETDYSDIRTAKWKIASCVTVKIDDLESNIHIVERIPSEGRGKPAQFIATRLIFTNKLSKNDKLLLAYDALILSLVTRRDGSHGEIIHGDGYTVVKVKTSGLTVPVRKLTTKIATLLDKELPPDLILNKHCAECEHQIQCRQKAVEKDELSLLAGMSEKERKKLTSTGIFTITQLSYTFRPRRRPKRLKNQQEKYHLPLKALAIRENKIHIIGSTELKIEGTPVYFDVEGLPDRDFYYLIGLRIVFEDDKTIQYSLWADTPQDEKQMWTDFLKILEGIQLPVLICYGSYETVFLRSMCVRYGEPTPDSTTVMTILSPLNILTVIYGRIYFPVVTNGLKDIAGFLGFIWSKDLSSGVQSIAWRESWEVSRDQSEKDTLIRYNTEDCAALAMVTQKILNILNTSQYRTELNRDDVVDISKLKRDNVFGFKRNNFILPDFGNINKAAYWDYQRERVYLKSNNLLKQLSQVKHKQKSLIPNANIDCQIPSSCPKCNSVKFYPHGKGTKKVIDLKFTNHGIKRWITNYKFKRYMCQDCAKTFYSDNRGWSQSKYGLGILSYAIYLCIELRVPIKSTDKSLNKLFDLNLTNGTTNRFKAHAAMYYKETYDDILATLCNGDLIHADETKMSVNERDCFVWVMASMEAVAYVCTETREGGCIQSILTDFKGVLVTDFYTAYDSIKCPQQKCLIHLMRDINDALYRNVFDEGLKQVAQDFTCLLKPMIDTIDRHGLKKYYLKKHLPRVELYYKKLAELNLTSDPAIKIRDRIDKNRKVLFTFLQYDGIPWNNNNAEHAIKAFAMLRHLIKGVTTDKGLRDYLILLSISETCKYKGVDFLDFLRSGQNDIDTYAGSCRRKTRCDKLSIQEKVEQFENSTAAPQ